MNKTDFILFMIAAVSVWGSFVRGFIEFRSRSH